MTSQRAMPETQLDVDLLILDYLLYMGTRTLLQEQVILREEGIQENLSQQPMRMIDCEPTTILQSHNIKLIQKSAFIPVFKCNHPATRVPDDVNFRLRLIKFTTLYSKRNVPCEVSPPPAAELERLRRKNQKRAEEFYDSSSDSSFTESLFEQRMGNISPQKSSRSQSQEESISLADLVPMFIGLSASRANLFPDDKVSAHEGWMDLAGEFMLQAALEQCLEYSDCSGSKLREIFSWGWRPNPAQSWEDEEAVNEMFCDEDEEEEVESWTCIKANYVDLVSESRWLPHRSC